ncbi:MAG: alpha-2-macroglobulin family protein, partial [Rhodospirillales bacterium]|nr:alpha-2-macroglobulin family protein [Rhodospirillales bacterium]
SGLVRLDDRGRARIPFEIPDFNGRLRLMAVAYDGRKLGHGEQALLVRDPLVSQITLPRFMAPRDRSLITLSLHNLEGPAGSYRLAFEARGAAGFADRNRETVFELAPDARRDVTATLVAGAAGVAEVAMRLEGPDGFLLERSWDLAVRPAQTLLTRRVASRLPPGESAILSDELFERFVPGTGEVVLTLSARPVLQVAGLLRSLSRYPYGCAEQTTSGALPLLYVSEVAQSVGVAENDTVIKARVQGAINRLLGMQRGDGAFGLWGPWDAGGDWLSAYVMDFLTQARNKGYFVPDLAYRRGLGRLSAAVSGGDFQDWQLPAGAYAAYVLAQAEQARLADLRYLHDVYLDRIPTAIARAQLGAALALYGDEARAASAFGSLQIGERRQTRFGGNRGYWDYGSSLRDVSAVAYLSSLSETGRRRVPELMDLLVGQLEQRRYTSTQEKAWLLLLASRFLEFDGDLELSLDGERLAPRRRPLFLEPGDETLARGLSVENRGRQPVWQSATISGVPAADQPAEANRFAIKRTFYSLDGAAADLEQLRQSDSLVVVIEGEAKSKLEHQALIVDLLPAGFEIENQRLASGRDNAEFGWLPELTQPRHSEPRDDRFVAALDLQAGGRKFAVAYVVRAVTPGVYRLPAPYVEDMYKPNFFARGAMSVVKILPRG